MNRRILFSLGLLNPISKLISITLLIWLISSCGGDRKYSENKSIFHYNEAAGLANLDPAFARDQAHIWVCNQLYNSLVQLDDNLEIKPAIAKSWDISPDGKTYTFHLRNDVYFHENDAFKNGAPKVKAEDFVYSFNRLLSPKLASPGAWTLSKVAKDENGNIQIFAPNDSTLKVVLTQAFPPFLGILSMQYCSVVPKEAVDYYGSEFGRNPVGTGPFYMQNWVESVKLILRKNTNYFEFENGKRLPYLDAVSISFVIDKMTGFLELVKGNIDFISGLDPSYKDEIINRDGSLKEKYKSKIYMIGEPYLNTEYLGILVDSAAKNDNPLLEINLRKAINYGFDRKKMIKFLRNNVGIAAFGGIVPPSMLLGDESFNYGYSFKPDSVKKFLNDVGYFDLKVKPEIKLITTSDYVDLCKFIQSQLGEFGLVIGVEVSPAGAVREMKANSKLNFFRASWIADYPDAENYLSLFISENFAPNGPNYTHFKNAAYDRLYEKAMLELDVNKRKTIYREMDSLMMTYSPVVVLYYDQSLRFVNKKIKGMNSNPINLLNLKTIQKSN